MNTCKGASLKHIISSLEISTLGDHLLEACVLLTLLKKITQIQNIYDNNKYDIPSMKRIRKEEIESAEWGKRVRAHMESECFIYNLPC